jgi:hypothetical protein
MRRSIFRLQYPRPVLTEPREARCLRIAPTSELRGVCIDLSGDNLPGRPPECDRPDQPP